MKRTFQTFFSDPRVQNWSLSGDVYPTVIIGIIYLFSIFFGRKWMKNHPAFELRSFMLIYNLIQVILCGYITYEVRISSLNLPFDRDFL